VLFPNGKDSFTDFFFRQYFLMISASIAGQMIYI
jgi:hypothetical protein